jgi:cytochrome b
MKTVKVWDIFIRVFHWSLVASIIIQIITAESFKKVHVNVGYFIIILFLTRLVWGFIGSKHARFADFIYPPHEIFGYLKGILKGNPKHYVGHNPAGGAMVFTMLFFLLLTTMAGLKTLGAEGKGPLADFPIRIVNEAHANGDRDNSHADQEDHDGRKYNREDRNGHDKDGKKEHLWKEIHEFLVGIIIFLIVIHICGVIVSSYLHKENLIRAMFTGEKNLG